VTLSLSGNTSAVLAGTRTVTAVNGLATFAGLSMNQIGTYNLTATSNNTGLTSVTSSSFNITSIFASKLAFITQPGGAVTGSALNPQPVVAIQDSQGNLITNDNTTMVTLAISGNTSAVLAGARTVQASGGVATFSGLHIDLAGSYSLSASSNPTLTPAISTQFEIIIGPASKLAFTTQPGGSLAGTILSQQPIIAIQDAQGNVVTSDNTTLVTLAISGNTSAALSGANTVKASGGLATFSGLSINLAGIYALTANSAPTYTTATSGNFAITAPVATRLAFQTQPGSAVVGNPMSPQPVVAIQDGLGNVATATTLPA